jgi:hypothetical protein
MTLSFTEVVIVVVVLIAVGVLIRRLTQER